LKKVVLIILTLSFLTFQFSEILIFLSFKINQETIAKTLCIEKDVENSTCKGCCQLKKKLADQHEQKEKLPPVENSKNNIDLLASERVELFLFPPPADAEQNELTPEYTSLNLFRIFHPPRI
jgi:hypothetical protein